MPREKLIPSTETTHTDALTLEQNQTYNLQQPIYLNSIPVVPNQQLVYQVEGVQNLNNMNLANSNPNYVYIVIPTQNENLQLETVPVDILRKDKQKISDDVSAKNDIQIIEDDVSGKGKEANKYFVFDPAQVRRHMTNSSAFW